MNCLHSLLITNNPPPLWNFKQTVINMICFHNLLGLSMLGVQTVVLYLVRFHSPLLRLP